MNILIECFSDTWLILLFFTLFVFSIKLHIFINKDF